MRENHCSIRLLEADVLERIRAALKADAEFVFETSSSWIVRPRAELLNRPPFEHRKRRNASEIVHFVHF